MSKLKTILDPKKLEATLKNDIVVKLLSLTIAIILFITVTGFGNPFWNDILKTQDRIDAVPLQLKYNEEKYVVNGAPKTIAVDVEGTQSAVESAIKQSGNLVATLDLATYSASEQTINSSLISFSDNSGAKYSPIIQNFDINIQEKVTETRPIEVSYIQGAGEGTNGYLLSAPVLSSQNVSVTGGTQDIASIVSVRGFIDLDQLNPGTTSGSKEYSVNLIPYNVAGEVVSDVVLSTPSITVTQKYEISSIELPIEYDFINNSTGMYVSSVCDTQSDNNCSASVTPTVKVYGDASKISELDSIKYQIDLSEFNGTTGVVDATPVLESGVYILGEENKTYNVNLEEGSTKVIKDVPVTTYGLSDIYQAKVTSADQATVDVTVTGAKSTISTLTKEDIVLAINLSEVIGSGVVTIPIELNTSLYFGYTLSRDSSQVEITEK